MSSNKFHKQNQQASGFKSGAIASEVTGQPKVEQPVVEVQTAAPVEEVKVEQPVVEVQAEEVKQSDKSSDVLPPEVGLPSDKVVDPKKKKEVKMMKVLTLAELPSYKGRRIPKGTRLVVPETAFDKNLMVEIKQEEK